MEKEKLIHREYFEAFILMKIHVCSGFISVTSVVKSEQLEDSNFWRNHYVRLGFTTDETQTAIRKFRFLAFFRCPFGFHHG